MTCGDIVVFSRVLTSSWKCSSHSILGLIGSLKSTRSFIENGLNKSSHTMWHKCDTSSYGMLSVRLSHVTLHELSPWVYHVLWGMNNHQWFFAVHWYHRFVHVPFDGFESTTNQVPFSKWVAWIWMNLIWLVVWNMNFMTFHIYWEFHHPKWRTQSFFGGVGLNHQPVMHSSVGCWLAGGSTTQTWIMGNMEKSWGLPHETPIWRFRIFEDITLFLHDVYMIFTWYCF